ncbi:hypothetical protein M2175_004337 [Bradyrhizobium elkanii]|uniref:hypothetical protein n=1 Tax=Bradyrhizobium TaxID=374 RepID=UPI0004AC92A7|nr:MULTISPECIES: hypothetical protein [Bradyrhizobium]MCS3929306.1 hypothetical protein [Bradyrhizobium elkanii]MCS3969862.1 hypothetical protein [Bradyrhizobium japonicum]
MARSTRQIDHAILGTIIGTSRGMAQATKNIDAKDLRVVMTPEDLSFLLDDAKEIEQWVRQAATTAEMLAAHRRRQKRLGRLSDQ